MQHYRTHLSPKSRRQHQQQQPSLQKSKAGSVTSKEQPRLYSRTMIGSNEHSDLYPLVETKGTDRAEPMVNDRYASATAVTRSRRATTLPSSFHPYPSSLASASTNALSSSLSPPPMQQHHHHHPSTTTSHWPPSSRFLTHSLPNLIKPLPMEPVSATSPALMATSPTSMNNDGNDAFYSTSPNAYHHHRNHYQPYHVSRRPQRAHSASSTCSSTSSSFLSPRQVNLSPPPLVDPTDVIYPKHFIQLPPPHLLHQDNQHHIVFSEQHQGEQDLLGLTHAVSIFGWTTCLLLPLNHPHFSPPFLTYDTEPSFLSHGNQPTIDTLCTFIHLLFIHTLHTFIDLLPCTLSLRL